MEAAINLRGVSKKYRKRTERPVVTSLKSYLLRDIWHRREENKDLEWVLRDINYRVEKGTTVGIVGRNGSGKSTLLKLISRILKPDAGTIVINGRVAALIELGAGFHPELTGRENVIINGVILGLTKSEIKNKFNEIVDFAELWDCIDAPVRIYSSGMYMRLAFSVAVHVDPEILLIDEVLAVGDSKFTQKCMDRMNDFKKAGKTIVVVSHDLNLLRSWCDEAIWINQGILKESGRPSNVIGAYMSMDC